MHAKGTKQHNTMGKNYVNRASDLVTLTWDAM